MNKIIYIIFILSKNKKAVTITIFYITINSDKKRNIFISYIIVVFL